MARLTLCDAHNPVVEDDLKEIVVVIGAAMQQKLGPNCLFGMRSIRLGGVNDFFNLVNLRGVLDRLPGDGQAFCLEYRPVAGLLESGGWTR
jgi:hypothetical protein